MAPKNYKKKKWKRTHQSPSGIRNENLVSVAPHGIHSAPKEATTALNEECSPGTQCWVRIEEIHEFNRSTTGSNKTSHITSGNEKAFDQIQNPSPPHPLPPPTHTQRSETKIRRKFLYCCKVTYFKPRPSPPPPHPHGVEFKSIVPSAPSIPPPTHPSPPHSNTSIWVSWYPCETSQPFLFLPLWNIRPDFFLDPKQNLMVFSEWKWFYLVLTDPLVSPGCGLEATTDGIRKTQP